MCLCCVVIVDISELCVGVYVWVLSCACVHRLWLLICGCIVWCYKWVSLCWVTHEFVLCCYLFVSELYILFTILYLPLSVCLGMCLSLPLSSCPPYLCVQAYILAILVLSQLNVVSKPVVLHIMAEGIWRSVGLTIPPCQRFEAHCELQGFFSNCFQHCTIRKAMVYY